MLNLIGLPAHYYYSPIQQSNKKEEFYYPLVKAVVLNAFSTAIFTKLILPCMEVFLENNPQKKADKYCISFVTRSAYTTLTTPMNFHQATSSYFDIVCTPAWTKHCDYIGAEPIAAMKFLSSGLSLLTLSSQFDRLIPVPIMTKLVSDFDKKKLLLNNEKTNPVRLLMFEELFEKNQSKLKELHKLCGLLLWSL